MIDAEQFVKELKLEVLYSADKRELSIETADVGRPGLQLAGFFDYFDSRRAQVMGKAEIAYLSGYDEHERRKKLEALFSQDVPCIIITHHLDPYPEMMELAKAYHTPIFRTRMNTTHLVQKLVVLLNTAMAPEVTMHGVFVDVYGVGVLILGESGIGKSETALELIKRGHRLVADDSVVIKNVGDELIGQAPEKIRYLMELRGIGIIDIMNMYGVGAVIDAKSVKMVVQLENWDDNKEYDRLGVEKETTDILEMNIPKITIPVRPGRNIAIIVEVAARNYRLKAMGIDTAETLIQRLMQ